jgi:transposase
MKGVLNMAKKSDLSTAQRREAVLMLLRREDPAGVIARRFGISEPTLSKWRDDFLSAGEAALGYGRNGRKDALAEQVRQLKRELAEREQVIGEITVANRILKKLSDGLS